MLPSGLRGNDLKELFVYDAGTEVTSFTFGSGASIFSFARIRDTSCLS